MKKINVVIIKELEHRSVVEMRTIEDSLQSFYDVINCDTIDIITRRINDNYYNIICDDEGRLKDRNITMLSYDLKEFLVGTLIICPIDEENTEELGSFIPMYQKQLYDYLKLHRGYDF